MPVNPQISQWPGLRIHDQHAGGFYRPGFAAGGKAGLHRRKNALAKFRVLVAGFKGGDEDGRDIGVCKQVAGRGDVAAHGLSMHTQRAGAGEHRGAAVPVDHGELAILHM